MGTSDDQPAGIQFPDAEENLTILDFLTPELDDDSCASDESYKYPDDKLDNNVPLNVEDSNEGILKSKLQRDHFQSHDEVDNDDGSTDGNDDDYLSIVSSDSVHSADTTNTNMVSDQVDIDVMSTRSDNDEESLTDNEPE